MRDVYPLDGESGRSLGLETFQAGESLACPECAELYERARSGTAPEAWEELKARVVAAFCRVVRRQVGTWIQLRRQARIAERAFYMTYIPHVSRAL